MNDENEGRIHRCLFLFRFLETVGSFFLVLCILKPPF
jgi:hypothetical protein